VNLLETLGAKIEKVVVSDLKENSYYAVIHLRVNGKTIEIDARPSDSLAIAVRVHCPIYINEKVLQKCPKADGTITDEEVDKFKEALKNMTPEEFFKSLEEAPPATDPFDGEEGGDDDEEEDKQ